MSDNAGYSVITLAKNALQQLQDVDVKVASLMPTRKLTLFLAGSRIAGYHMALDKTIKALDNAICTNNMVDIISVLCNAAIVLQRIKPSSEPLHQYFSEAGHICDHCAHEMLNYYLEQSPLWQLPENMASAMGDFVSNASAKKALPITSQLFGSLLHISRPIEQYNFRANILIDTQTSQLDTTTVVADQTQELWIYHRFCDQSVIYAVGSMLERPGAIYYRHQDGQTAFLDQYDNIALFADHRIFLSCLSQNQITVVDKATGLWTLRKQLPFPEEKKGKKISHLLALSESKLITVFNDGDCFSVDLHQSSQHWKLFYTCDNRMISVERYGEHQQPLLLMRTQQDILIFSIESLFSSDRIAVNTFPDPGHVTCHAVLGEGILAIGCDNGSIKLCQFSNNKTAPTQFNTIDLEGLLGYDASYIPRQLCHLANNNLAIRFYSKVHRNGIIMIVDPIHDHFIGKIPQSHIDNVDTMLPIPNGDLLVGNQQKLVSWSPAKREQVVYESEQAITSCRILLPNTVAILNPGCQLTTLDFPSKDEAANQSKNTSTQLVKSALRLLKFRCK